MEIRTENVEDLKSTIFDEYSSYFPIELIHDHQDICGCSTHRISDVTNYKLLAQYMLFDDFYKTLIQVQDDETSCSYNGIHCLLQENCDFYGKNDEFYQHCMEVHPTLILKNGEFEIDLTASYEQTNLLQYKDQYFIINRKFDKTTDLLSCSIITIDDNSNCNYQIIMKNGERDISCNFEAKPIQNYTTNDHILTEINVGDVQTKLNHPSVIIATISIIEIKENESENRLDYERLSDLECPVCCHYMMPPIKLCETGHSICSECMEQLDKCPLCQSNFEMNQRNITLELIADRLNFPCRNMDRGCVFVANLDGIRQHQKSCKFTQIDGLLNDDIECNLTVLHDDDLSIHTTDEHHDNSIFNDSTDNVNNGIVVEDAFDNNFNNQTDRPVNENVVDEELNCCNIFSVFGRLFKPISTPGIHS